MNLRHRLACGFDIRGGSQLISRLAGRDSGAGTSPRSVTAHNEVAAGVPVEAVHGLRGEGVSRPASRDKSDHGAYRHSPAVLVKPAPGAASGGGQPTTGAAA